MKTNVLYASLFLLIAALMAYIAPSHATRYVDEKGRHLYTVNDGIYVTVTVPSTPKPTTPKPGTPKPKPATPRPRNTAGGAVASSRPAEEWSLVAAQARAQVRGMNTEQFRQWLAQLTATGMERRVMIAAASVAVPLNSAYIMSLPGSEEGMDIAQGWTIRKLSEQKSAEVTALANQHPVAEIKSLLLSLSQ